MARGWESKSVEDQITSAETSRRDTARRKGPPPEELASMRQKENILLSRTRVARDLESAQNPRYRAQLTMALQALDAQLRTFAAH